MSKLEWPPEHNFVAGDGEAPRKKCLQAFDAKRHAMFIDDDLSHLLDQMYLPWSAWLVRRRARAGRPIVLGLCGGQGSGKSTVAALLEVVLDRAFGLRAVSFSIDDIYKTKEDRQILAQRVHPLFVTRGVPGTHDVHLGIATINSLKVQRAGRSVRIPSFDKATDTRRPVSEWPMYEGLADVIIFEGWCVGARPQDERELLKPINRLEKEEDVGGIWRSHVNAELAGEYQDLFGMLDILALLEVDSMQRVFEWRRLQEHKLAQRAAEADRDASALAIMSDAEVDRFIMHYERLTRHILAEMPARADIVFSLDETHNPARVRLRR